MFYWHGTRPIPWLKGFISHIIPLVYDDSLSYYEFLMKLVKKINELVEQLNKISDDLGEFIANYITSPEFREYLEEILSEDFIHDIIKNYSDTINVADFELPNDGTDGTEIMNAIMVAFGADANKRRIYFPTGTYSFNNAYLYNRNICIEGDHAIFTPIRVNPNEARFYPMFVLDWCKNVDIKGTVFSNYIAVKDFLGDRYTDFGHMFELISIRFSDEVRFHDNHMDNVYVSPSGYRPWTPADIMAKRGALWVKFYNCKNVWFYENEIHRGGGEEITLFATDETASGVKYEDGNYFIYNNYIHDEVTTYPSNLLSGNRANSTPINITGGTAEIYDNVFKNYEYAGSLINGFANALFFHNNTFNNCKGNAIDPGEGGRHYPEVCEIKDNFLDFSEYNAVASAAIDGVGKNITISGNYVIAFTPLRIFAPTKETYEVNNWGPDQQHFVVHVSHSSSANPAEPRELYLIENNYFEIPDFPERDYLYRSGVLEFDHISEDLFGTTETNTKKIVFKNNIVNRIKPYTDIPYQEGVPIPSGTPFPGLSFYKQPILLYITENIFDCFGALSAGGTQSGYYSPNLIYFYHRETDPASGHHATTIMFAKNQLLKEGYNGRNGIRIASWPTTQLPPGNCSVYFMNNIATNNPSVGTKSMYFSSLTIEEAVGMFIDKDNTMAKGGETYATNNDVDNAISTALESYSTTTQMSIALNTALNNNIISGSIVRGDSEAPVVAGKQTIDITVPTVNGYTLIGALCQCTSSNANLYWCGHTGASTVRLVYSYETTPTNIFQNIWSIRPIYLKNS